MGLSEEHRAKVVRAIQFKAIECGSNGGDCAGLLQLLFDHWDLFNSESAMDTYIAEQEALPSMSNQKQPTHVAIPLPVFQEITKILGTLPFEQVAPVMGALQECPTLSLESVKPGEAAEEVPDASD